MRGGDDTFIVSHYYIALFHMTLAKELLYALPCISLEQVEKKTEENKERDKEVEHLWDNFFVSFSAQPQIWPVFITTDATSCRTVGGRGVGRRTGHIEMQLQHR